MPIINQDWFNRSFGEYETPDEIFIPLDNEFHFNLDVCATAQNTKALKYFDKTQDGLTQSWEGTCWMNPPFGRNIKKWVKKAFEEWQKGTTIVCLLPSRTNTKWWHDWVMKGEIRFIKGEVKFKGQSKGLWMPLAIVIFGESR